MKKQLSLIILALSFTSVFFSSCKDEESVQVQIALAGNWKMSSECTSEDERATGMSEIYPGSGTNEIIITDIIAAMTVYYSKTGETPAQQYSTSPTSKELPMTVDGENVTINYTWNDPGYDPLVDDPEEDRSYTVSGTGKISDDYKRITLTLKVTFPNYDPPFISSTNHATPRPLTGTCDYVLVKESDDD